MSEVAILARPSQDRPSVHARIAGIAYLITIAAGLFAEAYVRAQIRSPDAAVVGDRLDALEQLYRIGVLSDGLMLMAYLVVTAMLYRLFKPASATLSLLAAMFSVVGIAMLAASMAMLVLPLQDTTAPAAAAALRAHGAAYSLTGLFFGPYCALIGRLVLRSKLIPSWIGWLMLAAGAAFVLDASLDFAAPALARSVPEGVMLVSLLAEGSLAVWLAVFGIRTAEGGRREAWETSHA